MMQTVILDHALRDTTVQQQHGNLFLALLEPFQMLRCYLRQVNAHLVLKVNIALMLE